MFSRQNAQPQSRTVTTSEMSKTPLSLLHYALRFLILFITALPSQVISQTTSTEQTTLLLTFKRQLGDPPSLHSWQPSSSSPCDWPEVNCTAGAATELHLANKDITVHNLPAATICGGLKSLRYIDLSNNSISGEFPTSLYNCSTLHYLDLSQNYLSGEIPGDVNRLRTLTFLNLAGNSFSGDFPPAIGDFQELRTLQLYQNNFNGTFPKEIGNLSNLETLELAYNYRLAPAPIPIEFGNMTSLKFMWMTNCNIIGEIPESFVNLVNLEHLDLSMNNLTGRIPSTLLLSLRNLQILYLYHNRLSGEIPSSVQALNLSGVDLSLNNLTGSISQDFGKLENLTVLHLYFNRLSGEIPRSLGRIPMLQSFRVYGNKLNGTLPPELGLHSNLVSFEVCDNQLSGGLPEHLCHGGALRGVIAFSNNLSGDLPQWLGNCSSLVSVQLYNNRFSGEVPLGLWTLRNLGTLMLSNNTFSGQLPSKLSWNMSRLEIRDNKFSGNISLGVSYVNLVVFDARNNMLSGEIPRGLTGLSRITNLMLDGNRLSGALPFEIISWQSLSTLTLSRNNLSGQIPLAMSTLPNLVYLDLSENDLSGEIPTQLANLKFVFLNLSSNKLSGNIPDAFNNLAYENSFLNNPNLCAYDPKPNLSSCLTKTSPPSSSSSSKFLVLILVVSIIVFIVTASFALCKLKKHLGKKRCGRKLSTWRLTSFQRLDLTEINLFSSLTDSNLIGSGGFGKVYRIASNRPGEYVAVKKIWNGKDSDDKLEKEFMTEVEILGNIRHSNIVKLLCCYSSENSKLLVYEYMENHSLDKWLHGKKKKPAEGLSSPNKNHVVLCWPTRLKIAIGAAQGLCYMHHDCSPPIIHRDVKSSNILLDSEFRAIIADFGLATILAKAGEPQTMSALAGSFGYIAPEYAFSTKINEKVDVFSFGVVLLELVTGREAKSGGEHATSLVEWAWQHYSEGKCLADALDEDIKETCHVEEMTEVLKLGLICTSSLPSARPTTREILQVLRQCCHPPSSRKRVASEFDITPLLGDTRYISSYKDSNAVSENEDSSLYSV